MWAAPDGVGAGQQRAAREELVFRVGGVAYLLDRSRLAAAGGEPAGGVGEVLLPGPGDLADPLVGEGRFVGGGEIGELLGDSTGGDELGAHPRQVGGVPVGGPGQELLDELVELRGAHDPGRDRAVQRRLLVRALGGVVAAREVVDADDRHDHQPADAGLLALVVQVACGGGEEVGGLPLVRRRPGRNVDERLDVAEGVGESPLGDHVDAVGARHGNDLVAPLPEHVDEVVPDAPAGAGYGDPHFLSSGYIGCVAFVVAMTGGGGER
jgi:hypothetical protein